MEKDAIEEAAGLWEDTDESGADYERRIRKGWRKSREPY